MNNTMKDEDIMPLSPEEIKAIGTIGIGPSKQDIFLNQHYRKLILAGVVLATAASLGIAWFSHNNDRKGEAGAQIVAAMNTATPALMHPASDYKAQAYELVMSEYADTASAPTAELLAALAALSTGNASEGTRTPIGKLEQFVQDSSAPTLLRARALCALATYHMQKEENTIAASYWNKLLALGESPYTALAYMSLGDMAKAAGNKEEARTHYQQAMTNCATSQLVLDQNIIATRLLLLDVDAPRPEAPAPKQPEYANPFEPTAPQGAVPATPQNTTPSFPSAGELYNGSSPADPNLIF